MARAASTAMASGDAASPRFRGPGARAEGGGLAQFFRARKRVLAATTVTLAVILFWRFGNAVDAGSRDASFTRWIEARGLTVEPAPSGASGNLLWLKADAGSLHTHRVAWVGARGDEAPDVYLADVRATDSGEVIDVAWISNITRTSGAVETSLVRSGEHLAYASLLDGKLDAIGVIDTRGEPGSLTAGWSLRTRLQNAITNLQETGRARGVGRMRYRVLAPASKFALEAASRGDGTAFELTLPGGIVRIAAGREAPVEGAALVENRPDSKGVPGTISWVVDTVRNTSFVGKEPIEWLESRAFRAKDLALRAWYGVVGENRADTEAAVAEDLAVTRVSERRRVELAEQSADIGWPPAPMKPMIAPVRGEGEWMPVVDDPFVKSWPGAAPMFYQSFIRVDPERTFARVYVTIWDPRVLQLHVMTGTKEPMSATGETGAGMAPRDTETLERVVAGFNGGFQALHGEFGMVADGRVYIPPKPWAATVAVYDDGVVGVGSWAAPPKGVREYAEDWATAQIPANMIALRQNLTSVVEDGKYNPWERWWWGAAPVDATEQTLIDRSGVCLTAEGFFAYFWGQSMSADALGAAMLRARCARGVHLDMNSAHTGFEYYNVSRTPFSPLPSAPNDDEFDGRVPHAEQLYLRARRMVRTMSTMRFPRYVGRDARDFFYLTMRPTLPGPGISAGAANEPTNGETSGGTSGEPKPGVFDTKGMPGAAYPRPIARTYLGSGDDARTWILRIDPQRAVPGAAASVAPAPNTAAAPAPELLAYLTGAAKSTGALALYAEREQLGMRYRVGTPGPKALVLVRGEALARDGGAGGGGVEADAALGVDANGFLVYAERTDSETVSLGERMKAAGALPAIALGRHVRLALAAGAASVGAGTAGDRPFVSPDAYEREVDTSHALPFVLDTKPRAEVLNPDLKPQPYWKWARLQDARVRYFREGPARFAMPTDGGVPMTGDGSGGSK